MLIGNLNPKGKPAQQLMELLWSEQAGENLPGPIFTFTSRLLELGYVDWNPDSLTVRLNDKGRNVAQTLNESMEGQLYRQQFEKADSPDG